jgi:hypothetical protein
MLPASSKSLRNHHEAGTHQLEFFITTGVSTSNPAITDDFNHLTDT